MLPDAVENSPAAWPPNAPCAAFAAASVAAAGESPPALVRLLRRLPPMGLQPFLLPCRSVLLPCKCASENKLVLPCAWASCCSMAVTSIRNVPEESRLRRGDKPCPGLASPADTLLCLFARPARACLCGDCLASLRLLPGAAGSPECMGLLIFLTTKVLLPPLLAVPHRNACSRS